jgi:Trypsin/PEP-CTERM motif
VKLKSLVALAAATALAGLSTPAFADALVSSSSSSVTRDTASRIQTGTSNGLSYTAASRIIGVTPTSSTALPASGGGGDPRYFPVRPAHNGVVALIMNTSAGAFICSGSLMADRRSILTAAHCVSDGAGTANPISTQAYFYGGSDPDLRIPFNAQSTRIEVTDYFVNAGYTGEVIDQNDIAVLRLADLAPDFATAYGVALDADLTGDLFNVAGVGGRSTIGGNFGTDSRTGFLRQGFNNYDFAFGDAAFQGFWTDRDGNGENFFGTAEIDQSFISDFDNGLAANDGSCRVTRALGLGPLVQFCDLGLGADEVNVAGGDSGGPQFVNGRVASVTSYGLSFGTGFGDIRAGLNSSFGEFSGYVPTGIHRQFILSSLVQPVPEASTWVMMIFGFGLVGSALRRRQEKVSVSFA